MRAEEDTIAVLVAHARRVPAELRERVATNLREHAAPNFLVLETCHRVEAYTVQPDDAAELAALLPPGGERMLGKDAVRHVITVAVGRDSAVIGEDQILHQLREAVVTARSHDGLDPTLDRLLGLALRAGRRARTWRQGPPHSLADLALAVIEARVGSLRDREVLVVGAGKMGRLAVRAALRSGAAVTVANRSRDAAQGVARQTGARLEEFDPGARVAMFDAVVVALAGPWPIGQRTVDALVASSAVVVDLSMPRAVPSSAAALLDGRFVSGDDLALADPQPSAQENATLVRLESLVDATTAEFLSWLEARHSRTAARLLTERAERLRQAELDELWRRVPDLGPQTRDAIDRMSRHLAMRLLRVPLERLGHDPDGRAERAARDLFAL